MDEETRDDVIGGRLADLLLHPWQRRIVGDVEVNDPPRADLHDDENVGDREEGCVLGEEVASPQLLGVVADEGAPGLIPARSRAARDHVATNCAGGMLDAALGSKFLGDLVLAPLGMIG